MPSRRSRSRPTTAIAVDPERLILTPHNIAHSEAGRRANLRLALIRSSPSTRRGARHTVNPTRPRWRGKR
jgi:hypothetical protein